MINLLKVFFGKIDFNKIKDSGSDVSFWNSEGYYEKLPAPINWEHGVFQFLKDDTDDEMFYYTFSGDILKKKKTNDFLKEISKVLKNIDDKSFLAETLNQICILEYNLIDFLDEMEDRIYGIEDSDSLDIDELTHSDDSNQSIWVFEVSKYQDPEIKIEKSNIRIETESDDLELSEKFIFCIRTSS